MRHLILVLMLAVCACGQAPVIEPGVSHELAKWRAAHYSDVRYKLNLTLEKMSPVLKGTIEIRVKLSEPATSTEGVQSSPPYTVGGPTGNTGTSSVPERGVASAFGGRGGSLIVLDWRKIKGFEDRSTITNVSINGMAASAQAGENHPVGETPPPLLRKEGSQDVALSYNESNDHLIFRDGVVEGENVIKLDFTSPILTSGSAITRYVDKEDGAEYIYSLFVPSDASTAFPVFDQPDLKARFKLSLVTPGEWNAVSNSPGDVAYEMRTGHCQKDCYRIQTDFGETPPISTYVFAFAAGNFDSFSECSYLKQANTKDQLDCLLHKHHETRGTSKIYVRRSQAAKFKPHAAEVFRLNREGIKYLETYFDYKFPFPKYDIVLIPEFPFGGMEHAGATFLREASVIFPTEPTANDYISRANLIFHEAAHQWFGDTVTMKWFDDLWLKEGFAEFMAYKTLEKVMPEYNAWKVFYERNKQAAYLTDSTKGTTPIYQPIANLSAAKSAYGNIVYRKAPSFLKQAEFYIGPDKFQTAVRSFLKKHEFANAGWEDLVKEFETMSKEELSTWAANWVRKPGVPVFRLRKVVLVDAPAMWITFADDSTALPQKVRRFTDERVNTGYAEDFTLGNPGKRYFGLPDDYNFVFPNYQDYGYGIFLLDDKSRDYVLKNIQNEKDDFLRSMMWGSLWDSVRETELDPSIYVKLVLEGLSGGVWSPIYRAPPPKLKNSKVETWKFPEADESTIQTLLGRVSTALSYYVADAQRADLEARFETMLLDRLQHAETPGQRITFFRFFVSNAVTERGRQALKQMLADSAPSKTAKPLLPLKTKDRFDIVTRLAVLGDPDAEKLLAEVEKVDTSDDAKRYAYAARAAFGTAENKAKFWNDFVNNKQISESWIEAAFIPYNSIRHADLTMPYLERSLAELPNLKRDRKIFFVNGWLNAFIGGQRSEAALAVVNKFLADNPNLDRDLRLKVLENVDTIERAVKIRAKYASK